MGRSILTRSKQVLQLIARWPSVSSVAFRSLSSNGTTELEHAQARAWLSRFNADTIPKTLCALTFSRSSGPGGQNVNKVNSKATLRLKMEDFLPQVPSILHQAMMTSRYTAKSGETIVVQSDENRQQKDNIKACFQKLNQAILEAGRNVVQGEPCPSKVENVRRLQRLSNEKRLRDKKRRSAELASRRSKFSADD